MALSGGNLPPRGPDPGDGGLDDLDSRAGPRVAMSGQSWGLALGLVAAVALGGVVFWQLNANRLRQDAVKLTDADPKAQPIGAEAAPAAPPLFTQAQNRPDLPPVVQAPMPTEPVAPPSAAAPQPPTPPAPGQAATTDDPTRLRAPALIVDLSEAPGSGPAGAAGTAPGLTAGAIANAAGGRNPRDPQTQNPNERFAAQFGLGEDNAPARARRMDSPEAVIPQGAVIPAVLETAINSDLPGFVRAVVSRDVRSFDGSAVLVPRGSRLVGQYRSGVALGQSRAFVIWTRLIRPDGAYIDLASPTTDALGRGGLAGDVDRHFFNRFGGAILLSLITAGARSIGDDDDRVIIDSTRGVEDAAAVVLQKDLDISPTIRVPQGAPIRIFVSRDLDFSAVGGQ